jgi:anaerobic dimethyl sulfoxide reductase subunit A
MYIPLAEGRHADESPSTGDVSLAGTGGIPHADPFDLRANGYIHMMHSYHIQYRSHSTHNNNAFLNELFKKDANGQPAFLSPNRARGNVWDEGVYEPVLINPATASQFGISNGDRVLISNDRGRLYASAQLTQTTAPYVLCIGQGSWNQLDGNGVDVGGNVNTVTSARPSRICQGMTLASGTLVKIEKA